MKPGDKVVFNYIHWTGLTGVIDSVYHESSYGFGANYIVKLDEPRPEFQPMSHKPEVWIKLAEKLLIHEISLVKQ